MRQLKFISFVAASFVLVACGAPKFCVGTVCTCAGVDTCDLSSDGTCTASTANCQLTCSGTGACSGTCGDNCKVATSGTGSSNITAGKTSTVALAGTGSQTVTVGAGSTVGCSGTGSCSITCNGVCTATCSGTGSCNVTCSGSTRSATGCQ